MSWDPLPSTFEKARRRQAYRRFARLVTRGRGTSLLALDEVKDRLRFFEQRYVGIRPIPVNNIVGTAGRRQDFDRDFLPVRADLAERWKRIERAFPEGSFPPIVVYQVNNSYFVVDGHHRVGIAKQRKQDFIDAEITELRTRYELPEGADIGSIIFREQQHIFLSRSGLERARPEARIEFTQPHHYVELLEIVRLHGFHLMMDGGEVLAIEDVAADWYDHVYLPTIEDIRREGLRDSFPQATDADLFLCIWQRRRTVFPERGDMTLGEAVRSVGEDRPRPKRTRKRSGTRPRR
jgi:hypothetical protein